jgi:hypothetical protein
MAFPFRTGRLVSSVVGWERLTCPSNAFQSGVRMAFTAAYARAAHRALARGTLSASWFLSIWQPGLRHVHMHAQLSTCLINICRCSPQAAETLSDVSNFHS